jgi:hypothetical protein
MARKLWRSTIEHKMTSLGVALLNEYEGIKHRTYYYYKDGNEFEIDYNGKGYNLRYKLAGQVNQETYSRTFLADQAEIVDVIKSCIQERGRI